MELAVVAEVGQQLLVKLYRTLQQVMIARTGLLPIQYTCSDMHAGGYLRVMRLREMKLFSVFCIVNNFFSLQ